MTKKFFAFLIALSLIFATSTIFARSEMGDSMDKAGGAVSNFVDGAGSVIQNAGSAISHGADDVGDAVSNGAKTVGGAVSTGASKMTSGIKRADSSNNDEYTASRTSNEGTFMGMNGNTWTWFILAITALAIIALVWYYTMQNKTEYSNSNNE